MDLGDLKFQNTRAQVVGRKIVRKNRARIREEGLESGFDQNTFYALLMSLNNKKKTHHGLPKIVTR